MEFPNNVAESLVKKGKFVGRLQEDDLVLVIGTIKESPREKKANLLRFGII